MEWIITGVILLITVYFVILRPGRLDFWRLASKHPNLAYELFEQHDCWVVFLEEPRGGYKPSLPEGEWDGPFKLVIPQLGWKTITVYGRTPEYEKTQQSFIHKVKKIT